MNGHERRGWNEDRAGMGKPGFSMKETKKRKVQTFEMLREGLGDITA